MKILQICTHIPSTEKQPTHDITTLRFQKVSYWTDTIDDCYDPHSKFHSVGVYKNLSSARLFFNLFSQDSFLVELYQSEEFNIRLQQLLLENEYDLILIEGIYMCYYLPTIRANTKAPVILRTNDIKQNTWYKYSLGIQNPVKRFFLSIATKRLARFENASAIGVDGLIVKSKKDRNTFRSLGTKVPIAVFSSAIDLNSILMTKGSTRKYYSDFYSLIAV